MFSKYAISSRVLSKIVATPQPPKIHGVSPDKALQAKIEQLVQLFYTLFFFMLTSTSILNYLKITHDEENNLILPGFKRNPEARAGFCK